MSDLTNSTSTTEWLTVTQAAERLLVDGRTVRRWVEEGQFPSAVRTRPRRGHYRIPLSDIEAFEKQRQVIDHQ